MPPPTSTPSESPTPGRQKQGGIWRLALLMAVAVFSLMMLNNWHYLFGTSLHEYSDFASDSLFIREAKHGLLLHGHYSRWEFYHPGPVLLDVMALGEAIFYDALHWVPTPLNGQLISLCFALSLFFGLAISIFARRLGGSRGGYLFFVPCALMFALWHYGAAQAGSAFGSVWAGQVLMSPWPVYPPVIVLLCFLVAAASTAAGNGQDLPIVVLAAGWLVHNYIALPLFVVPLTLLASAGLAAASWRRERTQDKSRPLRAVFTAGWRSAPRAHIVAAVLLGLYVLPLILDALHGADSNMARILRYVRYHISQGRSLCSSLCYFLVFGSYDLYRPDRADFGHYDAASILAFVTLHWRVYSLWAVALAGAPLLFLAARYLRPAQPPAGLSSEEPSDGSFVFLAWFYAVSFTAFFLTLVWGMKQDGLMYFYVAYFNISIWFCAALALAAALAVALAAWTRTPGPRRLRPLLAALLWLGVAGTIVRERENFRPDDRLGDAGVNMMIQSIDREAAKLPKNTVVLLDIGSPFAWIIATGVALELERLGYDFRVSGHDEVLYGSRHIIEKARIDNSTPLARWTVTLETDDPAHQTQVPLTPGYNLATRPPPAVDPVAATRIDFSRDGNFLGFAYYGWSPTEQPWTVNEERTGLIVFRPLPLPENAADGVDVLISAWSFIGKGQTGLQTMQIRFNDAMLGTLSLPLDDPGRQPLRVRISRPAWQEAVARDHARLQFTFPDAKSPAELGMNDDTRLIGGWFQSIEFAVAAPGQRAQP